MTGMEALYGGVVHNARAVNMMRDGQIATSGQIGAILRILIFADSRSEGLGKEKLLPDIQIVEFGILAWGPKLAF